MKSSTKTSAACPGVNTPLATSCSICHLAEIDRQRLKAFSTRQGALSYERALKSLLYQKRQDTLKWSVALAREQTPKPTRLAD